MLQEFNRKPVTNIHAQDNSYIASQQFFSNMELNQAANSQQEKVKMQMMETGHEFMETQNNEDSGIRQNTNMKINFDYHEQQAKMTKSGYTFKSKIKSQYELDKSSSQHESQLLGKRSKSMAGTRRPKKQLNTFDI